MRKLFPFVLFVPVLLTIPAPAGAQTTGLCSAIPDRAARLECLGRPAAPMPTPQPPAVATARGCTTAAPCTDARGAYYTTRSGGKRYLNRR